MEFVSLNCVKPCVNFMLLEDTTSLAFLRSLLDNLLPNTENIKVGKIEFRAPWIDTKGNVKYNNIKLKTNEDLSSIWRTYLLKPTKGLIEF